MKNQVGPTPVLESDIEGITVMSWNSPGKVRTYIVDKEQRGYNDDNLTLLLGKEFGFMIKLKWLFGAGSLKFTQQCQKILEGVSPVTIMAYCITPETGTHISRAPKNWQLQAWDGSSWLTLDTQSNYITSRWESQISHQFTIQYPKKYAKYRLYVQQVNGSDVVSIRKFQIFGLSNSAVTLKSSLMSATESTPLIDIDGTVSTEMEVSPNPNNGNFTIKLYGVGNVIGEQSNTNSLSYADALKSGRNVDYIFGQIVLIEIFDLKGKKVYSTITKEEILDINLSGLSHGIYIVKAIINNKKVITKKVVVK